MKTVCLAACLMLNLAAVSAQMVSKTMLRLPDTGQTNSYTNTFGEDADYSIHTPAFIDNADGTVTDTVTGLMWQKQDGGEMTIESAETYCQSLELAGYTDWRLPTALESFSILNQGKPNPAIDVAYFPATGAEYWWTGNRQANDANKVWVTNAGGGIGNHPKQETISAGGTKRFHARAVRDIHPPQSIERFSDNADGTVTDHLSGLVWQKTPAPDTLSWEQSLSYAENLNLAGASDWRLPNIKELRSLNDETRVNPSVNTAYFSTIGVKKYWSSTSLSNPTVQAWYLDTRFGITTYDAKSSKKWVICVRGGLDQSVSTIETQGDDASPCVFPNPFSDHISLSCGEENILVEMLDVNGSSIYKGLDIGTQDFSLLNPGVYFLRIPLRGGYYPIPIIKY